MCYVLSTVEPWSNNSKAIKFAIGLGTDNFSSRTVYRQTELLITCNTSFTYAVIPIYIEPYHHQYNKLENKLLFQHYQFNKSLIKTLHFIAVTLKRFKILGPLYSIDSPLFKSDCLHALLVAFLNQPTNILNVPEPYPYLVRKLL